MYCNMIFGGRAQEFIRGLISFVIKKAEGRLYTGPSVYIPPTFHHAWASSIIPNEASP